MDNYLESAEFYKRRYKNFSTMIIVPTLILFIGIFIFILVGRINNNISTAGTVQMPSNVRAAKLKPKEVYSLVDSSKVNSIKKNQRVYFTVKNGKGTNTRVKGRVTSVSSVPVKTYKGLSFYKVSSQLDSKNNTKNLRYGLNGTLNIIKSRETIFNALKSTVEGK